MRVESVKTPETRIQSRGKADPDQVRSHQPCRHWRHPREDQQSNCNRDPERSNLRQRSAYGVPVKENPCPRKVQRQLHQKEPNPPASHWRRGCDPDSPCGNRHQQVQQRPNRPKDPVRRRKSWPMERPVPPANLGRSPRSAHAAHGKTQHDPSQQPKPAHSGSPFCESYRFASPVLEL